MINKIYKIINNKFSRFFKFVFFIRYLFVIFFVATLLFLLIPQLFDYKKREDTIRSYLFKNYGLNINKMGNIKFNSFPIPSLKIDNLTSNFFSNKTNLRTKMLTIYPKLLSIYDYDNFQVRKIKLENNDIEIDFDEAQSFLKSIFGSSNKILFKNTNFKIKNQDSDIINFTNIHYSNYGYKKNIIEGKLFNKKFKIKLNDKINNIYFKLFNTGVAMNLDILEDKKFSSIRGNLKGKILKSNFKLNFIYSDSSIKIDKFFFRNKNLNLDNKALIKLSPFFYLQLDTEIKNLNSNIFENINITNFLKYKFFIKRLNGENNIVFKSKKFNRGLIEDLNIKTNLTYGRLEILKNFSISKSKFICQGNLNLLEEFPIFYFICSINSPDKNKLLKDLKVGLKSENEKLNLSVHGNINILNNKVNFEKIEIDNIYKASEEDLRYYKTTFENIIFDEDFLKMFDLLKVRKFLFEIN